MSSNIIGPYPKESVSPSETVAPIEEVKKRSWILYDIEEPVVNIRQKDLDNKIAKENTNKNLFQG